jgi:hypothetical protein
MAFRNEEIARIETVLDYHVGKDRHDKPKGEVLRILAHRKRRFFFITIMNILALVFFGYWFFTGITALPVWIFWILAAVFALNLVSVAWQKRQIDDAIAYVEAGQPLTRNGS